MTTPSVQTAFIGSGPDSHDGEKLRHAAEIWNSNDQQLAASLAALLAGIDPDRDSLKKLADLIAGLQTSIAYTLTAGAALGAHQVVRAAADGTAVAASSIVPGDVVAVLGITTAAALSGNPAAILARGDVTDPAWAWTPGQLVWLGPAGSLVQPAPATGDLRPLGLALSPTRLAVALGSPILRL